MAYDLVFRKQTPRIFSRGEGAAAATAAAGGAGLLAASLFLLIPRLRRRADIARTRREYSHDYFEGRAPVRLHRTMEMPAIPMADLVRQPIR